MAPEWGGAVGVRGSASRGMPGDPRDTQEHGKEVSGWGRAHGCLKAVVVRRQIDGCVWGWGGALTCRVWVCGGGVSREVSVALETMRREGDHRRRTEERHGRRHW